MAETMRSGYAVDGPERLAARATLTVASGGVTAPGGFTSATLHVGIKPSAQKLDLAILAADRLGSAAALFTTNLMQAAPVLVSREHLERTRRTRARRRREQRLRECLHR